MACDSELHELEECLNYKAKKARKIFDRKGSCYTCRAQSVIPHLPEDEKCKSNEKCYGWYSTEHHTLFCRERARGLRMFIPQIDKDLLPRFFELIELDEKYLIGLSSSIAKKIVPLEPIKIMSAFKQQIVEKCTGAEVIFLNSTLKLERFRREYEEYNSGQRFYNNFYEKVGTKTLFGSPRVITFFDSTLPAEIFLQLLSHHTKELQISNAKFTPSLELSDIIQKAPNLEILTIYDCGFESDVTYEKPWMADLLKYKDGKNMRHLAVKPDTFELDIENLVKFVSTKCAKDVRIDIQFNVPVKEEKIAGLWKKVSEYYDAKRGCARMQIGFHRSCVEKVFSLDKLKKRKQPKVPARVPTKRKLAQIE